MGRFHGESPARNTTFLRNIDNVLYPSFCVGHKSHGYQYKYRLNPMVHLKVLHADAGQASMMESAIYVLHKQVYTFQNWQYKLKSALTHDSHAVENAQFPDYSIYLSSWALQVPSQQIVHAVADRCSCVGLLPLTAKQLERLGHFYWHTTL